ncbi:MULTISPECIES: DUF1996 domain-containing protein [unclassified Streptomyces]|uniref:DUF1996 domain-containing protein n=1 Tax=Streptomyces TaxID=1883 RepID=UPI001FD4D8A8|nr:MULTISPECIES: DUF1996 domain-containing protein [unclassified Streptomyces]MCZ4098714.1 DUF1996 domain-containing protein [Streptomyces sp. H39-C1]
MSVTLAVLFSLLSMLGIGGALSTASAAGTLISQSRPATASSIESAQTPAGAVVDGDSTTRWASAWSDPQWIQIDLGAGATVNQVELDWETAYAKSYQIQTSDDAAAWTTIYSTTTSTGGNQVLNVTGAGRYIRMLGTARGTQYGYSLYEFKVYGSAVAPTTGYVLAQPQITGVTPSTYNPPHAYFHEFQAQCSSNHVLPDDPIVYPGQAGASHLHTFLGNTTTNANTTDASLAAGTTTCNAPGDKSGYWMPTVLNGAQQILPVGTQTIYYKTGINDYTSVRPFPTGLRFLVGSPKATATQFATDPGYVAGWECGNTYNSIDIPVTCDAGSNLEIRMQAPSCWNGLYLDTPDHKSHMAYPVNGVCPTDHPVALPMIEFKMAFPVSGDMSQVHLSSGRGFSFHYDFFNAWDTRTLAAMITHCIVGGLQCDDHGYDQAFPQKGAVLNAQYQLP